MERAAPLDWLSAADLRRGLEDDVDGRGREPRRRTLLKEPGRIRRVHVGHSDCRAAAKTGVREGGLAADAVFHHAEADGALSERESALADRVEITQT